MNNDDTMVTLLYGSDVTILDAPAWESGLPPERVACVVTCNRVDGDSQPEFVDPAVRFFENDPDGGIWIGVLDGLDVISHLDVVRWMRLCQPIEG